MTGASSGIGEALAHAFAREGARVVVTARRKEALDEVAARSAAPDRVVVVPADFEDPEQIAQAHARVADEVGPVDVLVNNAGLTQWSKAAETSMAVVRRIMEVNFFSAVDLTQRVVQDMLTRGRGHIVVMSSLNGHVGTPKASTYAASKHALQGYFEALRAELSKTEIRVTMVCPGFVDTGVGARSLTGDGDPMGERAKPPKKAIRADAVAAQTLDAVARGRPEIFPGGAEVAGVYLKRLSPRLIRRLIARQVKR